MDDQEHRPSSIVHRPHAGWGPARSGLHRRQHAWHGRVDVGAFEGVVSVFPAVDAAEQDLQMIVAEVVLGVELERRTGAFVFRRSLAVGYD